MSFASLPLLTSLLGGTTMWGSTNWERRVFVSCGPHFVLCMFVPELDTHWSPALQPACTPDTHSQSSSAVSLFSSLPVKQCGNTCTRASCGWNFAWPEGKVSALHSAMILFSVFQNPSPFQPNSSPLKLLRAPIRISPSACLTVFTTAFDPLIKRNTFTKNLARSCIITTAA